MGNILDIIGGCKPYQSGRARLIQRDEVTRIILQLNEIGRNERAAKRALQLLCDRLENGWTLVSHDEPRLLNKIDEILDTNASDDIRRWIYKIISLKRAYKFRTRLKYAIKNEDCIDNMPWLIGAIFSIFTEEEAISIIRESGIEFHGTPLEHASRLFSDAKGVFSNPPSLIVRATGRDVEAAKLICFLTAYGREAGLLDYAGLDPQKYLGELSGHDDALVAEYAAWAFSRADKGSIEDIAYHFEAFKSRPGNVRKWLYILASKNPKNLKKYRDVFTEALLWEKDESAREGLVTAITSTYDKTNSRYIAEMFAGETNFQIKIKLLQHMSSNIKNDENYFDAISTYIEYEHRTRAIEHNILKGTLMTISGTKKVTSILKKLRDEEIARPTMKGESDKMDNKKKGQGIVINIEQNNSGGKIIVGDIACDKSSPQASTEDTLADLRAVLEQLRTSLSNIHSEVATPPEARDAAERALAHLDGNPSESDVPPPSGWLKSTANLVGRAVNALPSAASNATALKGLLDTFGQIADKF